MAEGERDGFATWTLGADGVEVTLAPSVGMVCCSLRHRGEELLGQRRGLRAYAERGSTMGVPLLHPWANRLDRELDSPLVRREEHGLPVHGVLAASPLWQVDELEETRIAAELDFGAHEELLRVFPYPHTLRLEVELDGGAATWTTTLEATGDVDVPVAFGFHPYLTLPGVPRGAWEVELPAMRHLVLDERRLPTGEAREVPPFRGALDGRTFDDGFEGGERFALRGGGRELVVRFEEGFGWAQVFAPAADDVVCFEPMTAPANALASGMGLRTVAPGHAFTARFSVTVR
ncbi:MAG: aldose 1-epimerase [Actinomycetota bacterium]|nr:aldose 1-epimerase [Actinomycetota bacterium]